MSVAPAALSEFAPYLESAFAEPAAEQAGELRDIEGVLPDFLRGTAYLNGPARFQRGDLQYRNWLDGDGMVSALHVHSRGVSFVSRYVQGRKYIREEEAGRPIYRAFGTSFDGDRLKRGIGTESPYNVSVFPYQERLLAFGEQSLPMELDPVTLETVTPGRSFDFGGALNDAAPFSAHPKIDARTGELLNFGVFFAPQQPLLVYYRFDGSGQLACRTRTPLELPSSMHDFAASRNYVVFYVSPHVMDVAAMREAGRATIDVLSWQPERGSQLLVIDRATGEEVARIPLPGRYCLHTINAWERGGQLIVDVVELDRPVYDQYQDLPELFLDVPPGQPVRFTIDLAEGRLLARETISYRGSPDFPVSDPDRDMQECDELWMLGISASGRPGRKFFDQLVHARWSDPGRQDIWTAPNANYLGGEPVVCTDPADPRRAALICHVFDAARGASRFLVFDAGNVAAGPQATLHLPAPLNLSFHGNFHPAAGIGHAR